jgi:YjbE family integral membrane protein
MLDTITSSFAHFGITGDTMIALLQIIWIDLLLSGDNAVVIALACRSLPARQRRLGIVLGTATAIVLRILFALVITQLMAVPFLRLVGGILLLWIAVKLVRGEDETEAHVTESETLWQAVRTIAIADAVMSLDNVLAISAAAHGNVWLFIFGLLFSIPLIIVGSTMIMAIIARFPLFVWGGAALLGWIAGQMIVTDPWIVEHLPRLDIAWTVVVPALALVFVLVAGFVAKRSRERRAVPGSNS